MIFYTNWMIFPKSAATTWGPFIFIRPSKRDDVGLLAHEQVHVRQWKRNPFMFVPYLFSKKRRLAYEVEAYREQLTHYPERLDRIAEILATKYRLDITKEQALAALTQPSDS